AREFHDQRTSLLAVVYTPSLDIEPREYPLDIIRQPALSPFRLPRIRGHQLAQDGNTTVWFGFIHDTDAFIK
ncbi:MAG TPA: hypothetical protein PKH23_06865, partial [Bacillota bacterium]|nr:hypothetical protein [Bacillota bacterium]